MKPEERDLIDNQQKLMKSILFVGMTDAQRQSLTNSMSTIMSQYEEAAKRRDDAKLDEKTRKKYADICDSIAKSLPDITQGALSAASAFRKGDYISGSAAIMDICAAVAPVIGSLAAMGGPPGALIGALFSVIGQILTFFAPKQPSLVDLIE